jgi:FkbM family methyltransferase
LKNDQFTFNKRMRNAVLKSLANTPFENPVRETYSLIYSYYIHDKNFLYDKQTNQIMKKVLTRKSNCVDVGANTGSLLKQMLRFAPNGVHYAFEPLPDLYQKLVEKFPSVKVFPYALSDSEGKTSFCHVTNCPGYSGLRQRHYDFGEPVIEEITVETRRLDSIYPSDQKCDLIKIDVEGAEMLVLKGARDLIKRCKPFIVFEHGLGGSDYYGVTSSDAYDLLVGDYGMSISLMEDWLEGRPALTREDFMKQFDDSLNYYFLAHPRA